jgi:hypothetical protein
MYHKFTGEPYGENTIHYWEVNNELWLWKYGSKFYQSVLIGYPIVVAGGTKRYPTGYLYNTKDYYHDATTSFYVWYDGAVWVMTPVLGYGMTDTKLWLKGTTLVGTYNIQKQLCTYTWIASTVTVTFTNHGKLAGDSVVIDFVSGDGTPDGTYTVATASANSFTFVLTGSGTAGACYATGGTKAITAGQIEGRERNFADGLSGVYTPVSGSTITGNVWVGWKILQDGGANEFIQDEVLYASKETYTGARKIWWHVGSSTYVISDTIGTRDPAIGYWSCATLEGTYTRTYTGGGTAPIPVTYVISHKEYREKSNGANIDTVDTYEGQVAVWL